MTEIPKNFQLTFSVESCKVTNYQFIDTLISNVVGERIEYLFNFKLNLNINPETKLVTLNIDSVLYNKHNSDAALATLDSEHTFLVVNMPELLSQVGNGIGLPTPPVAIFISMAISSVRGMYAAKLDGTKHSSAVLPVMDVNQFFPKNETSLG